VPFASGQGPRGLIAELEWTEEKTGLRPYDDNANFVPDVPIWHKCEVSTTRMDPKRTSCRLDLCGILLRLWL
jgi:hypothetical protein